MDHLFNRLDGAYPGKWKLNFPTAQAIDNWRAEWARGFDDDGITPADIAVGLTACRRLYAWPPSQMEFTAACKPKQDATACYYEAIAGLEARGKGEMGEWSSRAVYWSAISLQRDLMGQTYAQVRGRWEAALTKHQARRDLDPIPPPRLQIAAPGKSATANDAAAAELAKLGAAGILKRRADDDPLRWARKIVEKHEAGHPVAPLVLRNAREALAT